MGRGRRCLGGVWMACVADAPSMVDRLQQQSGGERTNIVPHILADT